MSSKSERILFVVAAYRWEGMIINSTGESNQSKGEVNVTDPNCADQESNYIKPTEMEAERG